MQPPLRHGHAEQQSACVVQSTQHTAALGRFAWVPSSGCCTSMLFWAAAGAPAVGHTELGHTLRLTPAAQMSHHWCLSAHSSHFISHQSWDGPSFVKILAPFRPGDAWMDTPFCLHNVACLVLSHCYGYIALLCLRSMVAFAPATQRRTHWHGIAPNIPTPRALAELQAASSCQRGYAHHLESLPHISHTGMQGFHLLLMRMY